MEDLDDLARRAVDAAIRLADRAIGFAARVTIITAPICIISFLLGLAVFTEGMKTVWIVLGGAFLLIAIGGALRAIWRLTSLRRHAPQLTTEVRGLLATDERARRTVIDTVEAGDQPQASVIVWSRQFGTIDPDPRSGEHRQLSDAVRAVTTFPLHMLATLFISGVFGLLAIIFLIALAL